MGLLAEPFGGNNRVFADRISDDGTLAPSGTAIEYSNPFRLDRGNVWGAHFVIAQRVATYSSVITLWASGLPGPNRDNDDDWVHMVREHGWTGFPVLVDGNPSGGNEKDFVDVGLGGAHWYRFKVVQNGDPNGEALLNMYVTTKFTV